ncbi:MAG: glycosyltransferase, partial [Microlunatus sp.]|nr:glycosyltransferase [Microlunatus sp.]
MDTDLSADARDPRPQSPLPSARGRDLTSSDSNQSDSWDDFRSTDDQDEPDRWAWLAEQSSAPDPADLTGCTVTGILVTLDAENWLPETLAALSRSTYRPSRLVAVDNGSTDATVQLLERAHRHGVLDAVYSGAERRGFGAGVAAALREEDAAALREEDAAALREEDAA